METLPLNCFREVARGLDRKSICSVMLASRRMREVASANEVWAAAYWRDILGLDQPSLSELSDLRVPQDPPMLFWLRKYEQDYLHVLRVSEDEPLKTASFPGLTTVRVIERRSAGHQTVKYLRGASSIIGAEFVEAVTKTRSQRYIQFRLADGYANWKIEFVIPSQVWSHRAVTSCLPCDDVRFGILFVDERYLKLNGALRARGPARITRVGCVWVLWAPPGAGIKSRMCLAGYTPPLKDALRLSGTVELQGQSVEDISVDEVAEKLDFLFAQ